MEYIVNHKFIKEYAEKLTANLCRQFFVNKAFISGPEILNFHPENQLNLLIVKNIFLNWQKESLKLRSPFFDFEDEGVKQALKSFMNKLSNHIKVYRYDFEPLVSKSIADLILLATMPADFFSAEIEQLAGPKIQLALLKDFSRYIRVNRFVIEQVIKEIETSGQTETFAGETVRYVRKSILENPEKLESAEKVLSLMLASQKAAVSDFVQEPKPMVTPPSFLDTPRPEAWATTEYVPIPEPSSPVADDLQPPRNEDEFLVPEDEQSTDNEAIMEEVPVQEIPDADANDAVLPAGAGPEEEAFSASEAQMPEPPTVEPPGTNEEVSFAEESLRESVLPLHETLRNAEKPALAETLSAANEQAAPFRTLVPMHYRFTFINSLFDGNQDAWAEAVERIDLSYSFENAVNMLKNDYAAQFNWSEKEDNVAILFNYVERKF